MSNLTIDLIGRSARVRPGNIFGGNAKSVSITGASASGSVYSFPVGLTGVYTTRLLPLTYRTRWDPPIPDRPIVKGTTLTNEEIDANFRVLQDNIVYWQDTLEFARAIIANRFLTIVDLFNVPGKAQGTYLEGINPTTGEPEFVGYVFNGYRLQPEQSYNTLLRFFNNSPTTFYIPNDSTYNFPIGSSVLLSWNGSTDGTVTIQGDAGVTVNSPDLKQIARRFGKVTAIKVGNNEWELEGNLAMP